jgi:signal transduction histidine kinase
LVSEYRALRASVLSLWGKSLPTADAHDVDDANLFHASVDQSLAKAVSCYTKRVDESRDMCLAIFSHDLRNPLNSISMSAQLLPRVGKLDAESAELSTRISSSAEVMAHMISDLLDYTRTRLGAGMPVSLAPMDLRLVCKEVVDEFQSANPSVEIQFESIGDSTGEWDAARLRQVVSNLLGNAIQHGDRSAPIKVSLLGERLGVILAVGNQGTPIPPGQLQKIFDPLVQGTGAETPKQNRPGSIGLGLYIARELVTAHGGTIAVESSVQAGTVSTIHLPNHAPQNLRKTRPGASLSQTATAPIP